MELQHETIYLRQRLLNQWDSPLTGKIVSARVAVLHQYLNNGWSGTFDKGALLFTLVKCMAFKNIPLTAYMYETSECYEQHQRELKKGNPFSYVDKHIFREDRATEWRKKGWGSVTERIDDIKTISVDEVRKNAELIILNSPMVQDKYRGERRYYGDYTPDMIIGLLRCIDRTVLVQMAEKMAQRKNSYAFLSVTQTYSYLKMEMLNLLRLMLFQKIKFGMDKNLHLKNYYSL